MDLDFTTGWIFDVFGPIFTKLDGFFKLDSETESGFQKIGTKN